MDKVQKHNSFRP